MIEVQMGNMIEKVIPAMKELANQSVPAATAFKLKTIMKKIDGYAQTFYEQRDELIRRYGGVDETGNVAVKPENLEQYFSELGDVLKIQVQIDAFPINVAALGEISVSALTLLALDDFIQE